MVEDDRGNLRRCLKNGRRDRHVASLLTMTNIDAFRVFNMQLKRRGTRGTRKKIPPLISGGGILLAPFKLK